jgi:hypothetical protein
VYRNQPRHAALWFSRVHSPMERSSHGPRFRVQL